jgi:hypothetical protein
MFLWTAVGEVQHEAHGQGVLLLQQDGSCGGDEDGEGKEGVNEVEFAG